MRITYLLQAFWFIVGSHLTYALVTLDTIRNLTATTDEMRGRILGLGSVLGVEVDAIVGVVDSVDVGGGGAEGEQVVLSGGDEDGEEVEDTVAAALRIVCSDLLVELEKPLDSESQGPVSSKECQVVIKEYHGFLAATVKLLHEVQIREEVWRWSKESVVHEGVRWMQGLWASRRTNSQDRSFIEQQFSLYTATGCFGQSKEVLRRDVEIVEYLNDLMDLFP